MKLEPKSQILSLPGGPKRKPVLLHAASEPELNCEQVHLRACRMSGVLIEILNRRDSPEHIALGN